MNFECGLVREYDSDKKMYVINLDRIGDVYARRIINGADKPFPPFARVLCLRVVGLEWSILGEIDLPQKDPGADRPQSIDEAVADLDSRLRSIRASTRAFELPNFRAPGEEPQFAGDASIENRTLDQRSRSRVKVYAFGSVVAFASNLCFTLWHRLESLWFTQCRSFLLRAVGYEKSVTTRADDPRLVMKETIHADPLPGQTPGSENPRAPIVDRETVEGFVLPADGRYAKTAADIHEAPKVLRGLRETRTDYSVVEIDNERQSRRERIDFVEYDADGKVKKRTPCVVRGEGHVDGDGPAFKDGRFERWGDWLEITIDNETRVLRLRDLRGDGQEIQLADGKLSLIRAKQSVTLTDDGVMIKAKSFTVEADDDITETAGRNHVSRSRAGVINHRTS